MADKGSSRHLRRLASPVFHGLHRKGAKWLKKPSPGKHSLKQSISLNAFLIEKLGVAESSRQVKALLNSLDVLVDGVPAKDVASPLGLMDVVSIPKLNKHYRLEVNKGSLVALEIPASEANVKYCKVIGKTIIKKGKVQLNLHDSRNYLIEKEEDSFRVGDTLVLSLPNQELKTVLKFEKGAHCYIYKGRHSGQIGTLEEVLQRAGSMENNARVKTPAGESITLKGYLFVVDKNFKV